MQWNNCLKQMLPVLALAVSGLAYPVAAEEASPSPKPAVVSHHGLGTWVWRSVYIHEAEKRGQLLRFCADKGIERVLLQIPYVGQTDQIEGPADLAAFLGAAADAGIKVEALDGEPHAGLADQREATLRRLTTVVTLHKAQPPGRGFSGLHYDIEPYLTERWKDGGAQQVALETLATMQAIQQAAKAAAPELTIAYDIPPWYDKYGDELNVDFGGQHKNFHQHIQDLSDYVGVMSYRRQATGQNSVVGISASVISYAETAHKKFCLALETVPLKNDPQITFNGAAPAVLARTVDDLYAALKDSPAFNGVFIHDYDHFQQLLETDPSAASAR